MNQADLRDLSFVAEFHDFYSEVIRLRRFAATGQDSDALALSIWTRLVGRMERQSLFAGRSAGEIGFGLYREVQYVMAALADETFLRLEWPGREYWTTHLLETHLFHSHNAGEEFFTRMDRLLEQPERSYTDIYAVYLMSLSLGFRGKYWGVDDGGRIEAYRRRLFVRMYRHAPELFTGDARLFPDSYRHTLNEGVSRKLPSPSRWFAALALALAIWLGAAHLLWHDAIDSLEANVAKIESARESGQPGGQ